MVGTSKEMEARQGKTFSFQLSTHGVDKLSRVSQTENGHYIQQLDPPVYIPFNAEPKIALYDLSFANTFRNIGPEFKNQTVEWAQATSADWATEQTHTITIPPGNYNLSDLELQIARELLETNDGSATCIWGRMNAMAQEIKANHELSPSEDGMTTAAGVANPNVPGQFSNDSANPPLQFHELVELVSATSKVNIVLSGRHIKPCTTRYNPQTNRIEMILLGYSEIRTGSTLLTATLGFDDEQLATPTEHWGQVPAKNVANEVVTPLGGLSFNNGDFGGTAVRDKQRAASIDNTRSINVHLPGLVAGSYDTNGALGNGRVATVPITVKPGDSETWQSSAPLFMPCDVAGAYINVVEWFITNENNHKIDDQGGRISATVVLSWPAPPAGVAPPSSLQGRTDLESIRQPWAGMYR
jgi:hypothetical protein